MVVTFFFFSPRMTMDFIAERLGHANFTDLQEIDLPHCELRTIDVGDGEVFKNLRRLVTPSFHFAKQTLVNFEHFQAPENVTTVLPLHGLIKSVGYI